MTRRSHPIRPATWAFLVLCVLGLAFAGCTRDRPATDEAADALPFEIVVEEAPPENELAKYADAPLEKEGFDFELVNQDGRDVRFTSLRGKAVLVTSIFTRCSDVEMCPAMTDKMAQIQDLLAKAGLLARTHLLSISMDPEFDRPDVLARYADLYEIESGSFDFLTGETAAVDKILSDIRFYYQSSDDGRFIHETKLMLFAPSGRLFRVFKGTKRWAPEDVVRAVAESLEIE